MYTSLETRFRWKLLLRCSASCRSKFRDLEFRLENVPGNKLSSVSFFFFSLSRSEYDFSFTPATGTTGGIYFCFFLHSPSLSPFLLLVPLFPSFLPSFRGYPCHCLPAWFLAKLSTGKKLRIREGVTRSFPHLLIPRDSRGAPRLCITADNGPSTWQNSTQFPWNSRAADRPRNSFP